MRLGVKNRLPGAERERRDATASVHDEVLRYRHALLDEINLDELTGLTATQRRARLEKIVGHLVTRDGPVLSSVERGRMIRRVVDEALGLGVLEPLLADESVTEIMVNGPADIWVERDGRLEQTATRFTSEAQLYQTIDRIVAGVNRRVDESSPMVDARLASGERVNVIVPPLALDGPTLTIRRFPRPYTIDELQALGTLDEPLRRLLAAAVRTRCNILVSGGTGTGKTTLLNAISAFVPAHERIITIEDAAELQLQQPHVVALEARPANVEGKGEITIRALVRNSLRMRPDRIIVGEVRGHEALDMLQAMNTGHEGSLATVHANAPEDAIRRLETLASMSGLGIAFEALRDEINGAIDLVVHLTRGADGSRRVAEVAAVASRHRQEFCLQTISAFVVEVDGDPDPRAASKGVYRHQPVPAALAARFARAGVRVPGPFTLAHPQAGTQR